MSTNPHQFKRRGRYEFSYLEKEEMREKLPAMVVEVTTNKKKMESLKSEVKTIDLAVKHGENEIASIGKKIEDGFEMRDVACIRFKSYVKKAFIFVNRETWEVVDQDAFEPKDTQKGIGELIYPPDLGQSMSEFMTGEIFAEMGLSLTKTGPNSATITVDDKKKSPKKDAAK